MNTSIEKSSARKPRVRRQFVDCKRIATITLQENDTCMYVRIETETEKHRNAVHTSARNLRRYIAILEEIEGEVLKLEAENPKPKPTRIW